MARQIVFTSKAAKPPAAYSQAVRENPPARQGAKLPAKLPKRDPVRT